MSDRQRLGRQSVLDNLKGLASDMRGGPRETETLHENALQRLDDDTRKLRKEFINKLSADSRSRARDVNFLLALPKALRYVVRPLIRTLLGAGHSVATTGLFLTAKTLKDWALPVFKLADPFTTAVLVLLTAVGSTTLTRFATGRWRDAIEDSIVVERVFNNPDVLRDLHEQIVAAPSDRDEIFNSFIKKHQFSLARRLAAGVVEHGPAMALGAWAFDAPAGALAKAAADISYAPTWMKSGEHVLNILWSGLVGDPRQGIKGLLGHGKTLLGIP